MSKRFRNPFLQIVLLLVCLGIPSFAQTWANQPKIELRINSLIKQMTLEEKIGQLNQYSAGQQTGPGAGRSNYEEMIANGQIGSLFNVTGPKTNEYQRIAVEKSRLKIPILFGLDVIHGYRTTFPTPLAMSATWDPRLIEKAARVAATETTADGVRWTFSPMVDIARDARWGRIVEGAGEDPYLGSVIAEAYVRGYQGKSLSDPTSIAACAKHFVGYGAAEGGRDYNTTEIPERLLRQVYLPPFLAAKNAGAATFMSAFNSLNEVPASANAFTLDQILRKEWKFAGLVVSDWTSVAELIPHGIANDGATAARKALMAGVDMDMESNMYLPTLPEQVKSDKVPMSVVDEAVRRILRVKFALGLFDHPYSGEGRSAELGPTPDSLALARTIAEKSFVLLKNDGVLPLKPNQSVAVIGPLADDKPNMLGAWFAQGRAEDAITLRQALAEKLGDRLIYEKGTEIASDSNSDSAVISAGMRAAVDAAQRADVVVLALGEDANSMTAEASSRAKLGLPGEQEQLLKFVAQTGKPVVLVIFSGRPLALANVVQNAGAILEAWHPGLQAGPALVRTLYGENNPSGRLTVSFPRSVGQEPLYYNHLNTGRPLGDLDDSHPPRNGDEKFKSRYVDERTSPLFPFGFGLSYTQFAYSAPTVSATKVSAAELNSGKASLRVAAEVKNTGALPGEEVAQLYISERGTSVARPVRELKGFQKISLAPGEAKKIEFLIGRDELAFWNIDMKNVVEPAELHLWVAGDSASGIRVDLKIE